MNVIKKVIVVLLILLVGLRLSLFYTDWKNANARKEAEKAFQSMVLTAEPSQTVLNSTIAAGNEKRDDEQLNDDILGKIVIDTLDISYVILNGASKDVLAISIGKVTGPKFHEQGNLVLAGHNMRDGSFFGKLKHLKKGDTFRLIGTNGVSKEYEIFKKDIVKDTDLSPLNQDISKTPVITLITCTDDGKLREIYYAKQK